MGKVISNGKESIGAFRFSDRKRVALAIDDLHGHVTVYGYFSSKELAETFMEKLADLVGAERE